MSDKERYDELDRAIDDLLSEGEPAPTGDGDLDELTRLGAGLRDLPDPAFKERLRAELFPRPARRRWLSLLERKDDLASGIRRVFRRPATLAPVAVAAAGVAAAVVAAILLGPFGDGGGPAARDQAFGALPAPVLQLPFGGGGGGPVRPEGGTISYSLPPEISLPNSALAYRLRPPDVSAESVQDIATKLGFTEKVEPVLDSVGTVLGYGVGLADVEPRADDGPPKWFQIMLDGSISFTDGTIGPQPGASGPTEEQAIDAARGWLLLTGIAGSDPDLRLAETCGPGCQQVVAELTSPLLDLPVTGQPRISVLIIDDGAVMAAHGAWAVIDAQSTYPLRSAEQLVSDLEALRGNFDDLRLGGPGFGGTMIAPTADPSQDAAVTLESISLSHNVAIDGGGQRFLVPVYFVRGSLTQAGLPESDTVATWVPATEVAPSPTSTPGEGDALGSKPRVIR
jgi:hypothetical protein